MIAVSLERPWLVADLGAPRRVLSFAPHRPGFVTARHIVWREVRDADLTPDLDVGDWFPRELARHGHTDTVALLTSRDVGRFVYREARVEDMAVACLATVGLGNAEAVGTRRPADGIGWSTGYGTINLCVRVDAGLTPAAQIEALTIVAQARTAAVLACGLRMPDGRQASGTGTDCIALACDDGPVSFAGMHTALGEAIGRAVLAAMGQATADWLVENGGTARGVP
jgi:adenosylcobinamide amidohydrolase